MEKNNLDKRILKVGALLIILAFALFNFSVLQKGFLYILNLIAPFLIGGILAIFISVPLKSIEKLLRKYIFKKSTNMGLYRTIALVITLVIVFGITIFIFNLVIPQLLETIVKFAENLPKAVDNLINWAQNLLGGQSDIMETLRKQIDTFTENIKSLIETSVKNVFVGGLSLVTNTFSFLVTGFLAFFFSIYALFYKEKLADQVKRFLQAFLPNNKAQVLLISGQRASNIFTNFIGGTFKEALIFGLMNFIGMMVLGLPYKGMISVLSGFMTFIPYFGALLGTFIGFILVGAESMSQGLIFLIMAITLQQIEANIVYPRVVGDQVGLPGIWVMAAVTIGGSIMGLLGMILAVPVATLIYYTMGDVVEYKSIKNHESGQGTNTSLSHIMKKNFYKKVREDNE